MSHLRLGLATLLLLACDERLHGLSGPAADAPIAAADAAGRPADAGAPRGDGGPAVCEPGQTPADLAAPLAPGQVRAGRITDAAQLIGGESAEGRVGDYKLENGRVRFVFQAMRTGDNYITASGGVLDADLQRPAGEPGHDILDEQHPIVSLRIFGAECLTVLESGADGRAVLRYRGHDMPMDLVQGFVGFAPAATGIVMTTDYILRPDSDYLEMTTTVENPNAEPEELDLGDFGLWSDDGVDAFGVPMGFRRGGFSGKIDLAATAGERSHFALGVVPAEGQLDLFLAGLLGVDWDRTIYGTLQKTVTLAHGERASYTRYLAVGKDGDALTRVRFERRAIATRRITGVVTAGGRPVSGARVHVLDPAGKYVTFGATAADGRYDVAVPAALSGASLVATGMGPHEDIMLPGRAGPTDGFADGFGRAAPVTVALAADVTTKDLSLGAPGAVDLTIRDEAGQPSPAKAIFAFPGTPPALDPVVAERRPHLEVAKIFWTVDGRIVGAMEPGEYDLHIVRGFRHEDDVRHVTVPAGGTLTLSDLVVRRAVTADGWLQIDTHVHGGASLHGEATNDERIVTLVAEDLDLFVSSDHDQVIDYAPHIARLGVGDKLQSFLSEEVTTVQRGHFNPYPARRLADRSNGGAIDWWNPKWATTEDIFRYCRETMGAPILQVNHGNGLGGFFDYAGLDRMTGAVVFPDYYSDAFQVMELSNGKGRGNWEPLLEIWYGYLNRGRKITGVSVSDSHHKVPEPGLGRSFIKLGGPVGHITDDAFVATMLAGRSVATLGPLPMLTAAGGMTIGDTLTPARGGMVTLHARVDAPGWMSLETATLVVNGVVARTWDLRGATAPRWLDEDVTVPAQDSWVVLRVDGTRDFKPIYVGATPFAITNPMYIVPR